MPGRTLHEERGVALVTVLLSTLAIFALVTATLTYATGSMSISRHDQDWNAALSAAEAGVDDYIYRLNQNGNYWQYSATNPAPDGNNAFTGYVNVPGPASDSLFRYTPDASSIATDGTVELTVTGKVRNSTRTVYSTLRRRNFLDYLYFTDYETKDPALYVKPPDPFTPAEAQVECALHYYEDRDDDCTIIYFISRDTLNGPLHSNDALSISGNPQFRGDTSTSWNDPASRRWLGSGSPSFANPADPKYLPPLTLPPTNSSVKAQTNPVTGGTGCLYTGPTQVTFLSTGRMTVVSPFTRSTNTGCGPGANLTLPPNGVVYVQTVPSAPADPNYTSGCPYTGGYPPGLPVPIAGDLTNYACRDGDAFVSGTVSGQVTVASEHNVVVIDHTMYQGGVTGTDLLGLVANNYVEVFHPVSCTASVSGCNLNRKSGSRFTNPVIQAATLAVQHSFRVQNYSAGSGLGTLNVTGALSQRYRGIVGTFSGSSVVSGYAKNYVYDNRLKYLSPPHFLDPVQSAWQTVTWAEIRTPTYP